VFGSIRKPKYARSAFHVVLLYFVQGKLHTMKPSSCCNIPAGLQQSKAADRVIHTYLVGLILNTNDVLMTHSHIEGPQNYMRELPRQRVPWCDGMTKT
jgi:hypothetical protein